MKMTTVYPRAITLSDFKIFQVKDLVFHEKYGRDKPQEAMVHVCLNYQVEGDAVQGECDLCHGELYFLPEHDQGLRKICNCCYWKYNG